MNQLPRRLQLFILAQAGSAIFLSYSAWSDYLRPEWSLIACLALIGLIAGACKVDVNVRWGRMSLGFTATSLAFLVMGPAPTMLVNSLAALGSLIFNQKEGKRLFSLRAVKPHQALFNVSNAIISVWVMSVVYQAAGGVYGSVDMRSLPLPLLLSAAFYFFVNTYSVSIAIGWSQGMGAGAVWREYFSWTMLGFLVSSSAAAGLWWSYRNIDLGWGALLFMPPAYLIYYALLVRSDKMRNEMQHVRDLNRLNDSIITSLATAIDAKDRYTHKHINRVREYAVAVSEALGLTNDELEAVRIAALLHDIGKLGIPEKILCKPGKLTSEEFEIIKSHVEIGVTILEPVQFPWPVVPVVASHHERWDGLGYPHGQKGEEIPIGARIVSLVDVFDALTSDRPYRKAMPKTKALEILRESAGSQFDPRVVAAFEQILPAAEARIAVAEAAADPTVVLDEVTVKLEEAAEHAREVEAPSPGPTTEVLTKLLGEFPEEEALLRELTDSIRQALPASTCVVYLQRIDEPGLEVAHVSGMMADELQGMLIQPGEGIAGHVFQHRVIVRNAPAWQDVARRLPLGENLELSSALAVPLEVDDACIGVLALYYTGYNFYRKQHERELQEIAWQIGPAIDSARRAQQHLGRALEDPATGLPNNRAFTHFMRHLAHIARVRDEEFALMLVEVSDPLAPGRRATDHSSADLFQSVGARISETVRQDDYVARWGIRQFAVALPLAGEAEVQALAERLLQFGSNPGLDLPPASLLIGSAFFPADGSRLEELLSAASERLLAAHMRQESAPGALARVQEAARQNSREQEPAHQ